MTLNSKQQPWPEEAGKVIRQSAEQRRLETQAQDGTGGSGVPGKQNPTSELSGVGLLR